MKQKVFSGSLAAFLILFMASAAMAGNVPGPAEAGNGQEMSIIVENCSSCHMPVITDPDYWEVYKAYIIAHHIDVENDDCSACHGAVVEFPIPECGLCHKGQPDHHPLEGNNCSLCHGDNAAGSENSGPGKGPGQATSIHSDEIDEISSCLNCHSVGNLGKKNQNDEGANQHQRGR